MTAVAHEAEIVYRGAGPGGEQLVTVECGGQPLGPLGPLRHVLRHSHAGHSWGYPEPGPSDLARRLIIAALGDQAHCATCAGTGRIAIRCDETDAERVDPYEPSEHDGGDWQVAHCWDCEGGFARLPYQRFTSDVVAGLPRTGWVLTRSSILDWLRTERDRP